ncbi:hypothetical protein IC63_06195 [Paracoccus sphaerophysae]|uniref:Uncharacterized protein n=1 Tax=Paracoccus sphaerophysae TaxID=690417 RepID=A0A099FBH1_9RHOB|nr:hypothetical protein IC63_06195 [Paracoccus sphaerophysae]
MAKCLMRRWRMEMLQIITYPLKRVNISVRPTKAEILKPPTELPQVDCLVSLRLMYHATFAIRLRRKARS